MEYTALIDTGFDNSILEHKTLRWLPWIGRSFSINDFRLMIVGESHYVKDSIDSTIEERLLRQENDLNYTRDVIWESPVSGWWGVPTLDCLPKLILGNVSYNKENFWSNVVYYNHVQRMLRLDRGERPIWDDFVHGWSAFVTLSKLLKPTHCLFLGSEAHKSAWHVLSPISPGFKGIRQLKHLGRCWAYGGDLALEGNPTKMLFTQHPGSYFSHASWHEFLLLSWGDPFHNFKFRFLHS